ncbi:hypothetical protein C0V97_01235 [Asaia sp. W19]|nr:hypothetical protein C0V97_01235 [Asaia sp. W19]
MGTIFSVLVVIAHPEHSLLHSQTRRATLHAARTEREQARFPCSSRLTPSRIDQLQPTSCALKSIRLLDD